MKVYLINNDFKGEGIMSWCPNCKSEYREGFTKCSECGAELVEELEIEKKVIIDDDEGAFLFSVRDDVQAKIVEAKLNAYGIPVLKTYVGIGNVYFGTSVLGVNIFVPSKLLEEAKALMKEEEV